MTTTRTTRSAALLMLAGLIVAITIAGPAQGIPPPPEVWVFDLAAGSGTRLTGPGTFIRSIDRAWSPDGASVALAEGGDIWIIAADGSARRNLTNSPENELDPAWSPDGNWISYLRFGENEYALWIADVEGSERRRLSPEGLGLSSDPLWSPTGHALAFHGSWRNGDPGGLFVLSVDGNLTKVEDPQPAQFPVSWAPDGSALAVLRGLGPGQPTFVYIVAANGSGERLLTTTEAEYLTPRWSPDGATVLFTAWSGGLRAIASNGTGERELSTTTADAAWAPDSRRVALVENGDIYTLDVAAPQQRTLLAHGSSPRWSPDGTQVAFLSEGDLYVVSANGADLRQLTETGQFEQSPTWSPDGRRLLFLRYESDSLPETHPRSVTLSLRKHLVARGTVSATDGFQPCVTEVGVMLERRREGEWIPWHTTTTTQDGSYRMRIPDRRGRYRVIAETIQLSSGAHCISAASAVRRHIH